VREGLRRQRAGQGGRARREHGDQLLPAERNGLKAVGGPASVRDAHLRGAGPYLLGQLAGLTGEAWVSFISGPPARRAAGLEPSGLTVSPAVLVPGLATRRAPESAG
jgi:hypothetical protein